MHEHLKPLDREPVSVHAPFVCYPSGQYRYENAEERRTALLAALDGVTLGDYDERILRWLIGWDMPVVATVVSLLWRTRHAATHQAPRGGGESR